MNALPWEPLWMIGDMPVVGSLLKKPESLDLAVLLEINTYHYTRKANVAEWRAKMLDRHWDWLPRYGYNFDRNINNWYKERRERVVVLNQHGRVGSYEQLQCFCPNGLIIPPDGWLIHPDFDNYNKFRGQRAIFAKGIKWEERALTKVAWMQLTDDTEYIPLEDYEEFVEYLNNRKAA